MHLYFSVYHFITRYSGVLALCILFFYSNNLFAQDTISNKSVKIKSRQSYRKEIETPQMGQITITSKEARMLPAFMGEVDLFKVLQLKPGIQTAGEGNSGLYVRGGGPDQNLILLDNAPVYNPNHLFGFFSIFNPDAIQSIDLYKSAFPARFGGRLSSVIDVKMPTEYPDSFVVAGGIGLISSRLSVTGPVKKGKLYYFVGARRTYADVLTRMFNAANQNKPDYNKIPNYYFQDLNTKLIWKVDSSSTLTWTGYWGRDVFGYNEGNFKFDFKWGNLLSCLNWNRKVNQRFQYNLSAIYSNYIYSINNRFNAFTFQLGSQIRDFTGKADFSYLMHAKHTVTFGAALTQHHFIVGRLKAGTDDGDVNFESGQALNGIEGGVYLNDEFSFGVRWKVLAGVRSSFFYNQKWYAGIEPRLSASYKLKQNASLKFSYARMYQYIHLASNSGASLPTDIWYPSTQYTRPQISDQISTGISLSLFDGKFLFSDEVYYKTMAHQIDYKDGANLFFNNNLEGEFVYGKGWAYGNEIYLEKKAGKTTGWIGYTLSWTWRKFDEINEGVKFPARYDRRHDVNVVIMHKLSKRVILSATWVYGTGNATSLPTGRILIQDVPPAPPVVVPLYTDRNTFRLPAYHRMDVGLVWKLRPKQGEADLTFSIYNLYNRRNTYFIYFDTVTDPATGQIERFKAKSVSLFPVIPAVTFNFKW